MLEPNATLDRRPANAEYSTVQHDYMKKTENVTDTWTDCVSSQAIQRLLVTYGVR